MSISFSSANGGLFAANPLRTDRISIKGVNWFGAERLLDLYYRFLVDLTY